MHVSVPQCDVFGYFSIESEIVILIIPVDHYPKALQVGFSTHCAGFLFGGLRRGEEMEAFGKLGQEGEKQGSLRRTELYQVSVLQVTEAGHLSDSRM